MSAPNDPADDSVLWKIPRPNWTVWERRHKAKLWQAVALLCDLEPQRLEAADGRRDTFFVQPPEGFESRLEEAKSAIAARMLRLEKRDPKNLEESEVDMTVFASWASASDLPLPEGFPWKPQISLDDIRWPWGRYETMSLRRLAQAVDRFWKNYDPADHTTAPTNEQVATWLTEQGESPNIAKAIASILRADNLPSGRRPK